MTGQRILHYEVVRPLGRGGMGEVLEAVDTRLGRHVALKFVAPEMAADPDYLLRLEREARAAAALSHPNIATVYAFERLEDRPFIAMELLPGGTLRALLQHGPLPMGRALRIARDTASSLAHAHSRGIVHRDVKPENLMFDARGECKLTDFGLAHAVDASRLTRTGTTLGTAAYMAPESVQGEGGAASDVFALGVMLHEMLAGDLPFTGAGPLALLYGIANLAPRPVRERRPEVPDAVVGLLERMLEKDPARRIDAERARMALESAIPGLPGGDAAAGGEPGATTPGRDSGGAAIDPDSPTLALGPIGGAPLLASAPDAPSATAPTEELEAERMPRALPVRATPRRPRRFGILALLLAVAALLLWWGGSKLAAARRAEATVLNNEGFQALGEGRVAAARERFERAIRLDRGYAEPQINLARVEIEEGNRTSAAQRLDRVLRAHAGAAPSERRARYQALQSLGEIALDDRNWVDAIQSFESALREDSSQARSFNQLGYALLRAGSAARALDVLDRGLATHDAEPALHKNAGLAALALGDLARARHAADRALELDASFPPALALRARALARQGSLDSAVADLRRYFAAPGPLDSAEVRETLADVERRGIDVSAFARPRP